MSTRMVEDDWAHMLAAFRARLPRRGRKAEDDRRFLEALHFFTVENIRRRAPPKRFRRWNSVWKNFDRSSKAGAFEAFFDTLASMRPLAHPIQMFDSTIVRAQVSAAGAKGGKKRRRSVVRAAGSPRESTRSRAHRATSSLSIRLAARARGIAPGIPYKGQGERQTYLLRQDPQ
jgi:transposase